MLVDTPVPHVPQVGHTLFLLVTDHVTHPSLGSDMHATPVPHLPQVGHTLVLLVTEPGLTNTSASRQIGHSFWEARNANSVPYLRQIGHRSPLQERVGHILGLRLNPKPVPYVFVKRGTVPYLRQVGHNFAPWPDPQNCALFVVSHGSLCSVSTKRNCRRGSADNGWHWHLPCALCQLRRQWLAAGAVP